MLNITLYRILLSWGCWQEILVRDRSAARHADHDNAAIHKFDLRILNWFLIEKMAFGRHVCGAPGAFSVLLEACLGEPSKKISGNAQAGSREFKTA